MSLKILVVEDDLNIQKLLGEILQREGWAAQFVGSADEAQALLTRDFDLLIFDWMLPGRMSGLDLCKKAAALGRAPILMLTARSTPVDIVSGLEAGADDYVTKPFEPQILAARARALLRRGERKQKEARTSGDEVLRLGDVQVFPERFEAKLRDKVLELTRSEFKILIEIIRARGSVLSRKKLLQLIQEPGVTVVDRTIDTHVYTLRKKLGRAGDLIETVRGVGYRVGESEE